MTKMMLKLLNHFLSGQLGRGLGEQDFNHDVTADQFPISQSFIDIISCSILSSEVSSSEAFFSNIVIVIKMLIMLKMTKMMLKLVKMMKIRITFLRLSSSTWSSAQGWQ